MAPLKPIFQTPHSQEIPSLSLLSTNSEFNMPFDQLLLKETLKTLTLHPDGISIAPVPSHLHWVETVGSTNQFAWDLVQQGTAPGTVVIAGNQTAGRGQWGHPWSSLPGGLYLSLVLMPDLPVDCAMHLTLCSAWGIAAALRQQHIPVGIKWLNDLVIGERKLGGILTETRIAQNRIRQAVIGVGVNWRNPVPAVGINLQTVLAEQPNLSIQSLEQLAAVVIAGLLQGYSDYRDQGVEGLLSGYHSLLASLGQSIWLNGSLGTVIGVSSQGELQIQLSDPDISEPTQITLRPGEFSLGYGRVV